MQHRSLFRLSLVSLLKLLSLSIVLSGCGKPAALVKTAVPITRAELQTFLASGDYLDFHAESEKHRTASPHGAEDVRVFVDAAFFDALARGENEWPLGSASVKEIYQDGALTSFAVTVRTASTGDASRGYYWYEADAEVGSRPVAEGAGVAVCLRCHAPPALFLTTFPLR